MTSASALPDLRGALAKARHDEKWELLKPVIELMFQNTQVSQIAQNLKQEFGFDANEAAYRFRFKKWGWKKNISSSVKEAAIRKIQQRASKGKPSQATMAGQPLDVKKLKRQAKSNLKYHSKILQSSQRASDLQSKVLGDFLPFGNKIFVNWNMPFGLKILEYPDSSTYPSAMARTGASPSDLQILTPADYRTPPAKHVSPKDYVSPRSTAIRQRSTLERTDLFLRGEFDAAINSMNDIEKMTASKWLYQYWLFSFVTTKYWGTGPRFWNAKDLQFDEYDEFLFLSTSASPGRLEQNPGSSTQVWTGKVVPKPSQYCNYSIHIVHEMMDSGISDDDSDLTRDEYWIAEDEQPPVEVRLCQGLQSNDFSNIPAADLPLAIDHMARAAETSPAELFQESLTFAIMARNLKLVENLIARALREGIDLSSTYALHVATSYLDGGSTCCMILDYCCQHLVGIRRLPYINEHGHTVLDNLILTILKGHSKTPLDAIDDTLKRQPRFAGVEVDLCGRWDADDHCYRALLQSGKTEIPFDWKHKFCHTSVQSIYHCIVTLSEVGFPLSTASGIFVKYCTNATCGRKLQLNPLQALVLATFRLAQDGCNGEDLFGMSAILLCLLSCELKAYERAHISVPLLFGYDANGECTHFDMTPLQLARSLPPQLTATWNKELQVGWQVFCHILRLAEDMQDAPETAHEVVDDVAQFPTECDLEDEMEIDDLCFEHSSKLGHIWAAFQAEILTYRKQSDDDPWISERFDMEQLFSCLENNLEISIPILNKDLLQPYCRCGKFCWRAPVLREQVMKSHFGNLDIWDRSTFLNVPPRLAESYYC